MRRASHPWDRFYRYHEAPWRGERDVAGLLPYVDGKVLELGAGNGKLLRPLVKAGVDVVALEVSWHALRRLDHPARVLADAAALPFRDGAFAAVLDIHCGGHLDAQGRQALAAETHRVLRPGGHAVVERLGLEDLRAGQGTATDDPGVRRLQDGRQTWFANGAALDALYGAFTKVEEKVEAFPVHLRGVPAQRESVRCVYRT